MCVAYSSSAKFFNIPNHKLNWISTYRSLDDFASKQRKTEQPNRHVLTVRALKYSSKSQIYSVSRFKRCMASQSAHAYEKEKK